MNPYMAELAARACLVLGCGWLMAWVSRRASAAVRHGVWSLTMAGLLALPVAMAILPQLPLPWLAASASSAVASNAGRGATAGAGATAVLATEAQTSLVSATRERASWGEAAGAVWLLGTLLLLGGLAGDWRRAAGIVRRARPREGMGGGTAVSAEVRVPQVSGVWRPTILLPEWFAAESEERQRVILLHERAHCERRDCLCLLAARAGCALYWWNPLVWVAARKLRAAGEQAADDRVLAGARQRRRAAADYAEHLVESARALRAGAVGAALPAAMSYFSHLEGRVRAILDPARPRQPLGRRRAVGMAALAAMCLVPLAAARLAPQTSSPLRFEVASVRPLGKRQGFHLDEHSGPARLIITTSLHSLIMEAYGISNDQQLSGESGWFRSEQYEINATTAGPTTHAQMMLMLRQLLTDRFQLEMHEESRNEPVYLLETAPGGIKFQMLAPGALEPKDPPDRPGIYAHSFKTIPQLVANLNDTTGGRMHVDRPVLDHTGLTGRYRMELATAMVSNPALPVVQFPNLAHDLESQLGLRLVSTRAPMPAYVVVHAAPPTPN